MRKTLSRWYDFDATTDNVFDKLKNLNVRTQKELAHNILSVASLLKEERKKNDDYPLSLGTERVMGLYKNHKRRWYDEVPHMSTAIGAISTLPASDFKNIIDGISETLTSSR